MLNIGVIGLGNMGANHLRVYSEITNDYIGVCDKKTKVTNYPYQSDYKKNDECGCSKYCHAY